MPIAITLPTLANVPAKTILPQNAWFTHLPTAGTALIFKIKTGSFSRSITKVERKVASSVGIVAKDRSVITEVTNTFKFTVDEFTADLETLMNLSQSSGTGRVWVRDPDDATGFAALMTNEFSCTVAMDGEFSLDPANFSEVSFTVDVLGTFTYNFDEATV